MKGDYPEKVQHDQKMNTKMALINELINKPGKKNAQFYPRVTLNVCAFNRLLLADLPACRVVIGGGGGGNLDARFQQRRPTSFLR